MNKEAKKIQKVMQLIQDNQLSKAEYILTDILIKDNKNFDALYIKGVIKGIQNKHEECKNYLVKAENINSEHGHLQYNLGKAYLELNDYINAFNHNSKAIKLMQDNHEAWLNYGKCQFKLDMIDSSLISFNNAIKLKNDYYDAYLNKGNLLNDINRISEAIESYEIAIKINPNSSDVYSNIGIAFKKNRNYEQAFIAFKKSIELKEKNVEAYLNQGVTYMQLNNFEKALLNLEIALGIDKNCIEAYINKGKIYQLNKNYEESLKAFTGAIKLNSEYEYLLGEYLHLKMLTCDWEEYNEYLEKIIANIAKNKKTIKGFEALSIIDSGSILKKIAENWIKRNNPNNNLDNIKIKEKNKIKIGYYSEDFRDHPVSYLIAELIEIHDRNRFEIIGFYYGPENNSEMHRRVVSSFDQFINIRDNADIDIAKISRKLEIDIAIDLTGLTGESRIGIFSYRAAPIQISYLGYLGTIGAGYYDYIIADEIIIPNELKKFYTEKVIYLPSYQVNDSKKQISSVEFTRQEFNINENSFIYCCFNNSYKINPKIFEVWMRILQSVPDSVLILYAPNKSVEINLQREASKYHININRIIFVEAIERSLYLSRFKVADLFLDTYPYNAGTTASDSLWSGLPILTLQGETFASRISSSILSAIELPELISYDFLEYEKKAVYFGTNKDEIKKIKDKIKINKNKTRLFDTNRFKETIEQAYLIAYEKYIENNSYEDIIIEKND